MPKPYDHLRVVVISQNEDARLLKSMVPKLPAFMKKWVLKRSPNRPRPGLKGSGL
uniref:Uncharacterized protein n=1 Tax=Arion vulgaris TaxID=1028688 RepID=A0A0B6YCT7_9EUPU